MLVFRWNKKRDFKQYCILCVLAVRDTAMRLCKKLEPDSSNLHLPYISPVSDVTKLRPGLCLAWQKTNLMWFWPCIVV